MARTVIALYDDFASANAAVRELVDNGYPRDDISIMANDAQGEYGRELTTPTDETSGAAAGAGAGAGLGAIIGGIGGLLIGLGALTIPGIGPVIAAGPLAAAITGLAGAGAGAVAGGVAGGLIGALTDMGVPHETAQAYAEGIRRGGTLVTLRTDDNLADQARDIMNKYNPINIHDRVSQWRQNGWTGFDENARIEQGQNVPTDLNMNAPAAQMPNTGYATPAETRYATDTTSSDEVQTSTSAQTGTPDNTGMPEDTSANVVTGNEAPANTPEDTSTTTTPPRHYSDFGSYDASFRNHFTTSMSDSGYTYEQYQPAYRYGYDLATSPRYEGRSWEEVQPEDERYWTERNPGTWDRIKGAVRYAWEEVRDAVS